MKPSPLDSRALLGFWIAVGFLIAPVHARAATKTWAEPVNGQWSDGAKWSPAGVPASGDDVVITISGPTNYTVSLDINPTLASLDLGASSGNTVQTLLGISRTITLNGGARINAKGALGLSSTPLNGSGTLTNFGTGSFTNGTVGVSLVNQGLLITTYSTDVGQVLNQSGGGVRVLGLGGV